MMTLRGIRPSSSSPSITLSLSLSLRGYNAVSITNFARYFPLRVSFFFMKERIGREMSICFDFLKDREIFDNLFFLSFFNREYLYNRYRIYDYS